MKLQPVSHLCHFRMASFSARRLRKHGKSVARHLHNDIYEVRAIYNTKAYRILFACEGRFNHILLSLEGFQKKTQQTPKANIKLAEQRLADGDGEGKQSEQVRRIKGENGWNRIFLTR